LTGFDKFEHYPAHPLEFGVIVGRVANRIGNARFDLNGKAYTLDANLPPNALHGGPRGLSKLVWDAVPDDATNSVVFSITSPDGDMGYPGIVRIKATYRLDGNRLRHRLTPIQGAHRRALPSRSMHTV
jgi:aldose 1-epimerase